jgi:DNA-binding CsgD family transcriptional regulator
MINTTKAILLAILDSLSENGFSIGIDFDKNVPQWVHSNYQKTWVDRYIEAGFVANDPTIIHGRKHTGWFTWSELDRLYPGNPVLKEAREFDMPEGNTLSIRVNRKPIIVSCSGPAWTPDQVSEARSAALGLLGLIDSEQMPTLISPKSLEVIRLMCKGLRDKEIATELGIKLETVRQRRTTAQHSLGANTSAQLISETIQLGLI